MASRTDPPMLPIPPSATATNIIMMYVFPTDGDMPWNVANNAPAADAPSTRTCHRVARVVQRVARGPFLMIVDVVGADCCAVTPDFE